MSNIKTIQEIIEERASNATHAYLRDTFSLIKKDSDLSFVFSRIYVVDPDDPSRRHSLQEALHSKTGLIMKLAYERLYPAFLNVETVNFLNQVNNLEHQVKELTDQINELKNSERI